MQDKNEFDVIIIGGSYAGLSAAMALGRSLRKVLLIDAGKPCNKQTPHSHNFLTQDGKTPKEISVLARKQVEVYPTIKFHNGIVKSGSKTRNGFEISTEKKEIFRAKKLIFSTGIKDIIPEFEGFSECWGISIIHCPYCHGYEFKNEKTGILGNGDYAFEFSKMINNLTKDLTLFTNGKSTLTDEQVEKIQKHGIRIIEKEIVKFHHQNGQIKQVIFSDGTSETVKALYAKVDFKQHTNLPHDLGCELDEGGYLTVDQFQKTTVEGVFACGDNTTYFRSVVNAISSGNIAGAMSNKELIEENW